MSKTARLKSERKRQKSDYYPTPYGLAVTALELLANRVPIYHNALIVDAGAGDGHWGWAWNHLQLRGTVWGVDINFSQEQAKHGSEYAEWYQEDYLEFSYDDGVDMIIGNPPFSLAQEFVYKSHDLLKHNGYLCLLLRIEFLASQKRFYGLWQDWKPKEVWISSRRPSFFDPNGGNRKATDMQEYAVYLWRKAGSFYDPKLDWFIWDYLKEDDG